MLNRSHSYKIYQFSHREEPMLPQLETKAGVRDYQFDLLHSQLCDERDQQFETFQMMEKKISRW